MFKLYLSLTKPRITVMVLVTAALGFIMGAGSIAPTAGLFIFLLGTALSCAGASVLNQVIERDVDALMQRTSARPLPSGKIGLAQALAFGVILVLSGTILLAGKVNLLTAFIALLTAFLYVLVYTPLKRVTWLNTAIGAIPGALPPLGGWTAASGNIDLGGMAIFLILFVWQQPHFYAIAWMCRDDYARAGLRMLPVVEPDGRSTFRHIFVFSLLLIPVSLLPVAIGLSGPLYLIGALLGALLMLVPAVRILNSGSYADARSVLRASIVYLPLLFSLIVLDGV